MTERNISKATEVGIEYAAEQAFDKLAVYYLERRTNDKILETKSKIPIDQDTFRYR